MTNKPVYYDISVRDDVQFGVGVRIVRPANLYGCSLGDGVFVGPFTEIQSEVVIGARTTVQSHAFICSLVTIGNDCFISHGAMFINDDFKVGHRAFGDKSLWRSTVVEDGVHIGTHATIMPVRICAGSVIGAGAVVTTDIVERGIYAGNPARLLRPLPPYEPPSAAASTNGESAP